MVLKCANFVGVAMGIGALALHAVTLPLEWYPDSDMGKAMKAMGTFNVQVKILPIVTICLLAIAVLGLICDLKADKIPLRLTCIALFLASSGVILYSGGWFIYEMIRYAAQDESIDFSSIGENLKEELSSLSNIQNLNGTNFGTWWNDVTGFDWSNLRLRPGPFVAICAGVVDLIVCMAYACMSCCGICS